LTMTNIKKICLLIFCAAALAVSGCAASKPSRTLVNSAKTPLVPAREKEFYYCEVASDLREKQYPAVRLRASSPPDYFEFLVPTGESLPGRCYFLAMPDL